MNNDQGLLVGVLALQGDFAEHIRVLDQLHVASKEVRSITDLAACDALILPGGESTVMMQLMQISGLDQEIIRRVQNGMPVFGTCAGAVVLSDARLALMDISVERNAYGSQLQSFAAEISIDGLGAVRGSFIRAPRITRVGTGVRVLGENRGFPVVVAQKNMLVSTFHTEVTCDTRLHKLFLQHCGSVLSNE